MRIENQQLRQALADLLRYTERQTCMHEETYRGGSIWTFCCGCGKKWADDEGGFIPYTPSPEMQRADRLISLYQNTR